MFAVLQVINYESNVLSRIKERLNPTEPELIEVPVKNGIPFFIIRIKSTKEGIPWADVERMAGLCAHRMLFPAGIIPAQGSGIRGFVPARLPSRLLFNSAYEVISHAGRKPADISVSVIDLNAELTEEIPWLFKLASTVRVITKKPWLYEPAAEKIMDSFGATLVITDDVNTAEHSTIVISPQYTILSGREKGMVFTIMQPGSEGSGASRLLVTGTGIELPYEYTHLKPPDIDEYIFACALYEVCGVKCLCRCKFEKLFINNSQESTYAIAKLL